MSTSVLHRLSLLLLFTTLFITTPAYSGHEASTSNLKACVDGKLAPEKQKANPKVDSIVTACKGEYDALVADLPPGVRDQVMHDIRDKIKKKLK